MISIRLLYLSLLTALVGSAVCFVWLVLLVWP
jgi:hypothetical protein